jgi:hypothetical protein
MRKMCAKMVPKDLPRWHSVMEFLASEQITVLEHPPCSLYLAPNYSFSVPEDKGNTKRKAYF